MNTTIEEQESKKELGTVSWVTGREIRTLDMISGEEYAAMSQHEKEECVVESTLRSWGVTRPKAKGL